jgi:hypothetical protein
VKDLKANAAHGGGVAAWVRVEKKQAPSRAPAAGKSTVVVNASRTCQQKDADEVV